MRNCKKKLVTCCYDNDCQNNDCYDSNLPIKVIINSTNLTAVSITPLILTNLNCPINFNIIIGTNSITFKQIGIYKLKGYINLTNNATTNTNFQLLNNLLSGSAIINPNNITYGAIKPMIPITFIFNYDIQVTVPNTVIQLSVRSTSVPAIVSEGKLKITKI